jgi:hypothetical protein
VTSLFSRKSATPAPAATEEDPEPATARPRGYTPSKKELGKVTPKRSAGGPKSEPPPANRREAMKRMRGKERSSRSESRAAMMAGDERYLLKRDKGPERKLVRDVVDSRRNLASYFLIAALVFFLGDNSPVQIVRTIANSLSILMLVALVVDSYLISRKIKAAFDRKLPKSTPRPHYYYGILRSMSPRRLRVPNPQVKLGEQI